MWGPMVVCIRFRNFKHKIRLVKRYSSRGYKVEILDGNFIYAESKEYQREKVNM